MPKKFRDLYAATVKGAIPIPENEYEEFIWELAQMEEENEQLKTELAKRKGGAPRKTSGDAGLAQKLINESGGNLKLAKQKFMKVVTKQDQIGKKRATERFRAAVKSLKT